MVNELCLVFSLIEDETECIGLPQNEFDKGLDSCKYSAFIVLFGGGTFRAPGFPIACQRHGSVKLNPSKSILWKTISFNWSSIWLKLGTGPSTKDLGILTPKKKKRKKKVIILRSSDSATQDPPSNFNSIHFNYRISGLPIWCYTPEIGRHLAAVLEDSNTLEICTSNSGGVG